MSRYAVRPWRAAVVTAILCASAPSAALAEDAVVGRAAFSTTVRTGDAFKTRTYPEQVNFKDDDGKWTAIDRSLESKSDGTVHPAAVDGDATIPSKLTKPVVIEHDGRAVSFRLLGADADADRDVAGTEASFDDALAGVNVSYKVRPTGLKELIELKSRSSRRSFAYDVRADSDLNAAIVGGDLILTDAAGKERFRVAAPLAWDSAELPDTANALTLSVAKTGVRQWRLTMRADDEWLNDPARVYPVTLDPDYVAVPDSYWVDGTLRFHGANQDCALAGNDFASRNLCDYTALQIGYGNGRPYKSVVKFDVAAAIPSYARVTASRFLAWQFTSSQKLPQSSRLRTVTSAWDNTATWNKRIGTTSWTTAGGDVSTAANLTGDPITIGPSGYWSYWPAPVAAVSGWIKGTLPNYGFQVSTDATTPTVKSAYEFTSTNGAQNLWPALEVTWVPDTTAPSPITVAGNGSANQSFLGGAASSNIAVTATDENSGIRQMDLLRDGNEIAVHGIPCPGNTCPLTTTDNFTFNTTSWTEGAHTLQVRVYDDAGNTKLSAPWTVYVDRTAPGTVPTLAVSNAANGSATVQWTAAPDNQGGSGTTGYAVSYEIDGSGVWSSPVDTTALSFVVSGVAPGDPLSVRVAAFDRVGNRAAPDSVGLVVGPVSQDICNSTTLTPAQRDQCDNSDLNMDNEEADIDYVEEPAPTARSFTGRRYSISSRSETCLTSKCWSTLRSKEGSWAVGNTRVNYYDDKYADPTRAADRTVDRPASTFIDVTNEADQPSQSGWRFGEISWTNRCTWVIKSRRLYLNQSATTDSCPAQNIRWNPKNFQAGSFRGARGNNCYNRNGDPILDYSTCNHGTAIYLERATLQCADVGMNSTGDTDASCAEKNVVRRIQGNDWSGYCVSWRYVTHDQRWVMVRDPRDSIRGGWVFMPLNAFSKSRSAWPGFTERSTCPG